MVTTTYLLLVAVLGALTWWYLVRNGRSRDGARTPGTRASRRRLHALLAGAVGDEDLVERMAEELARHTVAFGSSHAVPGHLGAELPVGLFEAATASRTQLTHEVLQRYCALMDERCQRLGRAPFALPDRYGLHLALACGPDELLTASFEAIVDVRAVAGRGGARTPLPVGSGQHAGADDGPRTRRRSRDGEEVTVRRAGPGGPDDREVVLEVDGTWCAQGRLSEALPPLSVGRGGDVTLRCPESVEDVSRRHLILSWSDGRCYVEDEFSANGTRLCRPGGETEPLAPGVPTLWAPGEVLLLDEDQRARVTLR